MTDSYIQIQSAIDYAYSNNKKVVVFPKGKYKITNGGKVTTVKFIGVE